METFNGLMCFKTDRGIALFENCISIVDMTDRGFPGEKGQILVPKSEVIAKIIDSAVMCANDGRRICRRGLRLNPRGDGYVDIVDWCYHWESDNPAPTVTIIPNTSVISLQ